MGTMFCLWGAHALWSNVHVLTGSVPALSLGQGLVAGAYAQTLENHAFHHFSNM